MSDGKVHIITSSDELDSTVKKDQLSVVWIFDSDGANRSFGKQYEQWVAVENKGAFFYKAGTDDVKEAIKSRGLSPDWISYFKNGDMIKEEREDHNSVYRTVQSLL